MTMNISRKALLVLCLMATGALFAPVLATAQDDDRPTPIWFVKDLPVSQEDPSTLIAMMEIEITGELGEIARDFDGAYVLRVSNGTLCFRLDNTNGQVVTIAHGTGAEDPDADSEDDQATCEGAVSDCIDPQCTVQDGDIVQLGAGSSIATTGAVEGVFWNPDDTNAAILLVTDLYPGTGAAACRGGCW